MRAYKILPVQQIRAASLSKAGLKRLVWIDWYQSHGKKVRATCRNVLPPAQALIMETIKGKDFAKLSEAAYGGVRMLSLSQSVHALDRVVRVMRVVRKTHGDIVGDLESRTRLTGRGVHNPENVIQEALTGDTRYIDWGGLNTSRTIDNDPANFRAAKEELHYLTQMMFGKQENISVQTPRGTNEAYREHVRQSMVNMIAAAQTAEELLALDFVQPFARTL